VSISAEALASLKVDLALEHGAIVQYVIHGVLLRDSAITEPVRRIAREEMWHFEWLVEAIHDRGGEPVLDRADVILPQSTTGSMIEDVATEGRALDHYARTLELIGDADPELTQLIERIVDDERHHRARFERLAAEVQAAGDGAYAAHAVAGPEDLSVVGPAMGVEYETILQYLWNKYGCGDCEQSEQYFEFAIDEMRHMNWAASYVPGLVHPTPPDVPTDRVRFVHSTTDALERAVRMEGTAIEFYSAKSGEAKNEDLTEDLSRALSQHEFHRHVLERLD
jgi:bacterioferritin